MTENYNYIITIGDKEYRYSDIKRAFEFVRSRHTTKYGIPHILETTAGKELRRIANTMDMTGKSRDVAVQNINMLVKIAESHPKGFGAAVYSCGGYLDDNYMVWGADEDDALLNTISCALTMTNIEWGIRKEKRAERTTMLITIPKDLADRLMRYDGRTDVITGAISRYLDDKEGNKA